MPVIRLGDANDEFPVAYYAKSFYGLFQNQGGLPPNIKLHAPLVSDIVSMFRNSNGAVEVDITVGSLTAGKLAQAFNSVSIQKVWIRNNISTCNDMQYAFAGNSITGIYGEPLDLSSATNVTSMFGSGLQDVTFVPSSIPISIRFPSSNLTTVSLLSITNGLDETIAGQTLTVTAAVKAIMDALMVDNVSGTAVEGTAMSLTTFITTIKGWSVAIA